MLCGFHLSRSYCSLTLTLEPNDCRIHSACKHHLSSRSRLRVRRILQSTCSRSELAQLNMFVFGRSCTFAAISQDLRRATRCYIAVIEVSWARCISRCSDVLYRVSRVFLILPKVCLRPCRTETIADSGKDEEKYTNGRHSPFLSQIYVHQSTETESCNEHQFNESAQDFVTVRVDPKE